MLPIDFLNRMKDLLGNEYEPFLESYNYTSHKSLRINPFKGDIDLLKKNSGWDLTPVPWCTKGYYYPPALHPGRHPFHDAGVYYIQEASAMLPATLLQAKPGEKVLDLCAAPGGKSTQIAADMEGRGLLICNEIIPGRAKILSENIERMGISNAIVTNADSDTLAEKFVGYFHKIMVDAPCSGEGMFRKNEDAPDEWSIENVNHCAARQLDILENAAKMLAPGGRIVYSTCTFAPEENEGTILHFLENHPEFSTVDAGLSIAGLDFGSATNLENIHFETGMTHAKTDIISSDNSSPASVLTNSSEAQSSLRKCIRLWPHKVDGEGHFAAILEKSTADCPIKKIKSEKGVNPKELKDYLSFENNYLMISLEGTFIKFGEQLYLLPKNAPDLKGLKVLRPGLHLGTFLKNRFEPSHALALHLSPSQVKSVTEIDLITATNYLAGQTFSDIGEKGWHLITTAGYPLGWGKLAGGIMKNHYPKGLRKY